MQSTQGQRGTEEGCMSLEQPFPRTGLPACPSGPLLTALPLTCLLMHSTTSVGICVFVYFKSVVTYELRHNCRNYYLCLFVGHFYMSSFCFLRATRKRKLTLDRMRSEGIVVLANENLLFNFHPPLCQVLELKEIIVGIVSVFRKMNYW